VTTSRLAAALAALLLGGCGTDFVPGSVLSDLRVLSLAPDPPEVGPGESVTVRPLVYEPPGDPVSSAAWSFCPLTAGPRGGYRCLADVCEVPLAAAPDGSVTADPSALALDCLAALGGSLPSEPGTGLPDRVETVFRYVVRSVGGAERSAIARVPLSTLGPPADRNLPPIISGVEIGGAPASEGAVAATARPGDRVTVAVAIDPASIQTYVDGAGRTLAEQVVVSFYTTAGRFPEGEDLGEAPVARTALELRDLGAESEALLYVVARDLRGGQAWRGPFRVAIER